MKHFQWTNQRPAPARTIYKEGVLPIFGVLGITAILVAIFALCLYLGKGCTPVIPIHVDDGETVDPNPFRLGFMIVAFVAAFIIATVAERKGLQGKIMPAFWWGYAGGTLLWQSTGECAWHFSIQNEDYLMCFPHIEGASAVIMVIITIILISYCWHRHAFGWGVWVFALSFIGNWFGHFAQIGTYPMVSSLMPEGRWFLMSGITVGALTVIAALILMFHSARDTKARLCCCLMLYFGIGMIATGIGESKEGMEEVLEQQEVVETGRSLQVVE